jgi:threonine dehydratase
MPGGNVPDVVLVPCGGGGLVSGIAVALSGTQAKVIAVEPAGYDGMGRSMRAGHRTTAPGRVPSLADSLMAQQPGQIPFALAKDYLFDALTVEDADLERAVGYAFRTLKLVVEPGGSAGLAALLAGKLDVRGRTIVVVLSGGNCDLDVFTRCCARAD